MGLEDKTEAPTYRRRQEAREEGRVAKSVELNSALILVSALYILRSTGPTLALRMKELTVESLTHFPKHDLSATDVTANLAQLLLRVGIALAPLVLGVAVVGFVSNVLQVGFNFSTKALQVKGDRLNPLSGITRMFSMQSLVELAKSIAKISIIGFIVYSYLKSKCSEIGGLVGCDFSTTCGKIGQLTYDVLFRAAMALFVIAALDYMYQRFQHEKGLKMTKQEVKDDAKRSEGDPLIKGKIRQKQREMSQRRMMQEVPKADVVVVNPTHFAVALKYDSEVSPAPIVLAKGKNYVALKIREIAEENHIPIVENIQLARTLYASVDIGQEIPADLYQAVAEILAYVYRLSHRLAG